MKDYILNTVSIKDMNFTELAQELVKSKDAVVSCLKDDILQVIEDNLEEVD